MYTIKGHFDTRGDAVALANSLDLKEALAKAAAMRKQGIIAQIWQADGTIVIEPETPNI